MISFLMMALLTATPAASMKQAQIVEWTVQSRKTYADAFNDVDVDVIFSRGDRSWRVPMFWRGAQRWTVRFAPPAPGEYTHRLQSTDPSNPDLNGHEGRVTVSAYDGRNDLLRHGALRVSSNKRYFVHADGAPFYWLGDTWWTGLSDRLSWEGFQKLTADRKAKGFTVVQIVVGLVPLEDPPSDPGCCNEGGCVWKANFTQVNPGYFDYADRRIRLLIDNGLVPVIVGGWNWLLPKIGVERMKKHWRYIIARYGAYPVVWSVGGEVFDPPQTVRDKVPEIWRSRLIVPGWTEVARYLRSSDPYSRLVTAHEIPPPADHPLQDENLADFELIQSGQFGWPSVAASVVQITRSYSRTSGRKPVVQGEIGYENHYYRHFDDYQRTAFWLSMLNGAAGHTYGADAIWGAYAGSRPLQQRQLSFLNWDEGMNLAGSYQVGLGAKLLRRYEWWRFEPHPEWVAPRGATYLEPHPDGSGDEFGLWWLDPYHQESGSQEADYPKGKWEGHDSNFRRPYAAGIPGKVRFIYAPINVDNLLHSNPPPTVLGLEFGVRYDAYMWEPSLGIRFELGAVQRPQPGSLLFSDEFDDPASSHWRDDGRDRAVRSKGKSVTQGDTITVLDGVNEQNVVAKVAARGDAEAHLTVRYRDRENYVAARYSREEGALCIVDRRAGRDGPQMGKTPIPAISGDLQLSIEVRGSKGAASITDGARTYTTPIVDLDNVDSGSVGLVHQDQSATQSFDSFQLRASPTLVTDRNLPRKLYDARGEYRGDMDAGDYWKSFGRDKSILLDGYRPEGLPTPGDWIMVLEVGK